MSMVPLTPDTNQHPGSERVKMLAADDPRHGTYAGAVAHWFTHSPLCGPCKRAETRYRKTRKLRALRGDIATVPALGTLRRVRALYALGWTGPQIAEGIGVSVNTLRSIAYRDIQSIRKTTAIKVATGYEAMAMVVPVGPYANRTRLFAAKRDWPPPLAWDDIDDPAEQPTNWRHEGVDRHADLNDMLANGFHLSEVTRSLGLSVEALEKWCDRNGRRDDFNRLMARERGVA